MKIRLRDGSGHRIYRYLYEDVDRHGNVRVYFWRGKGHRKTRIKAPPGTTGFHNEYQAAYDAAPLAKEKQQQNGPAPPASFRWLCERYFASTSFGQLQPDTRRVRRRILESMYEKIGDHSFRFIQARHVAKLRDEKRDTPEAANARVKALRQLFSWATEPENGFAEFNPARDVKFLLSNNPDGHSAWTEDDVTKYKKRHPLGTKARLALDILLCTGVRVSDAVKLGPQMERDGKLHFTETKGGSHTVKAHAMPILGELRASIDATPTGHLVYLVTEFGKPYSVKGFGNWFSRQTRLAGIKGKSAHGVRKLAAIRWAEIGATEEQLKAWFGWTSAKQSSVYTKKANRERLEASMTALTENKSFPLSSPVEAGGKNRRKKVN